MTNEGIEAVDRPVRRGGGRPTREEALRRDARLLDVATTLFMERGFDGTSIDAVAETAGVSKPTVYARYHDKRDLFAAVLRGRIREWLAPISAFQNWQSSHMRMVGYAGSGVWQFCFSSLPLAARSKWTTPNSRPTCSSIFCSGTPRASPSMASQSIRSFWSDGAGLRSNSS